MKTLLYLQLLLACFILPIYGRPQVNLTPREFKAFNKVLGRSRALKVESAIPVLEFSDKTPSKFVKLPLSKLGVVPVDDLGRGLVPAKAVHIEGGNSPFQKSFGRGATKGPVISPHSTSFVSTSKHHQPHHGVTTTLHSSSPTFSTSHQTNKLVVPSTLEFGFKPLYESSGGIGTHVGVTHGSVAHGGVPHGGAIHGGVTHGGAIHGGTTHGGAIHGGVTHGTGTHTGSISTSGVSSFSPSTLIHDAPSTDFHPISSHGSTITHSSVSTGGFSGDLGLDFGTLGKHTSGGFERVSVSGKDLIEDGSLYRHHVRGSLIPTSGAGPRTNAVGKLLAAKGSELDNSVVARSVNSGPTNIPNTVVSQKSTSSVDISKKLDDSKATLGASFSVGDSSKDSNILNLPEFSTSAVFVNAKENKASPVNSGSIFSTSSVQIPKLPNVQLPLQSQDQIEFSSDSLPSSTRLLRKVDQPAGSLPGQQSSRSISGRNSNKPTVGSSLSRDELLRLLYDPQTFKNSPVTLRLDGPPLIQKKPTTKSDSNSGTFLPSQGPRVSKPKTSEQKTQGFIPSSVKPVPNKTSKPLRPIPERKSVISLPATTSPTSPRKTVSKPAPKPAPTSQTQIKPTPFKQNQNKAKPVLKTLPKSQPRVVSKPQISPSSAFGSLPASALQALGALGGGNGAGQPQIIVKTLTLDAKDSDPSSAAFQAALKKATQEARAELGVSSSEELGVAGADLAGLLGRRRRKRQLFGGGDSDLSTSQTLGNAFSTGAGLFGSTLGIFLDTTWEAFQSFLRGTETLNLLAIDQVERLIDPDAEPAF